MISALAAVIRSRMVENIFRVNNWHVARIVLLSCASTLAKKRNIAARTTTMEIESTWSCRPRSASSSHRPLLPGLPFYCSTTHHCTCSVCRLGRSVFILDIAEVQMWTPVSRYRHLIKLNGGTNHSRTATTGIAAKPNLVWLRVLEIDD